MWGQRVAAAVMDEFRSEMIQMLPRLRRFARGLTGSTSAADDLVQGACERALRAADSWQPGTRFDSWMYRIVRNLWIDDRRKTRPEPLDEAGMDPPGEDGRRVADSRLRMAEVRDHISALPEGQREVLMLVCVEDMSYREAADVLGVPIGTIMSRLARARVALAESLGETTDGQRVGAPR